MSIISIKRHNYFIILLLLYYFLLLLFLDWRNTSCKLETRYNKEEKILSKSWSYHSSRISVKCISANCNSVNSDTVTVSTDIFNTDSTNTVWSFQERAVSKRKRIPTFRQHCSWLYQDVANTNVLLKNAPTSRFECSGKAIIITTFLIGQLINKRLDIFVTSWSPFRNNQN